MGWHEEVAIRRSERACAREQHRLDDIDRKVEFARNVLKTIGIAALIVAYMFLGCLWASL